MRRDPARRAWGGVMAAAALLLTAGVARGKDVNVPQLLYGAVMTPATAAAAAAAKFPVSGMELRPGLPLPPPAAGDQVVALVSLVSPESPPAQWLLRVQMAVAASAAAGERDVTLYTTMGDTFVFHSEATALMDLDILGPVAAGRAYGANRHRVAVSPDFLGLDLGGAAETIHRIGEVARTLHGQDHTFGASSSPFPAGVVAAAQKDMAPFGLTAADRRSFAGAMPALREFLNLVQGTPGLEEILLQVLDKPSLLDVVRHGGRPDFFFRFRHAEAIAFGNVDPAQGGTPPAGHLMVINLELFGKPVLTVALIVTAPRPPLEATAGIVGVVAWGPDHPEKTVVVRVLATRFAAAP